MKEWSTCSEKGYPRQREEHMQGLGSEENMERWSNVVSIKCRGFFCLSVFVCLGRGTVTKEREKKMSPK